MKAAEYESLVEKLNRTPGATPRSFCRGTLPPSLFLTYEQIKKLPASRKPASIHPELASGHRSPVKTISQRSTEEDAIQRDIIFRPAPPPPSPYLPPSC